MLRVWRALATASVLSACAGGAPGGNGGPIATGVGSASSPPVSTTADDTSDESTASTDGDDAPPDDTDAPPAEASSGEIGESSTTDVTGDPSGDPAAETSTDDGDDTSDPACPNLQSCDSARILGMVSGDVAGASIDAGGSEATWLTFQVTEDNDAIAGEALSFTATLTSPPGVDFDLFVYRGAANGPTGCGGVMDSSTSNGSSDVVHMSWGEGGVANGVDDRSWVAVEIVVKGDACGDGSAWTLVVDGDS